MTEPVWIERNEAHMIHDLQISEFGGAGGTRDVGMFESAMDRPRNLFAYGDPSPSLTDMAASYAFGLAKNHPFVDGNKRTALVVCLSFLAQNGVEIAASQEETYLTFYGLASGEVSETELAAWLEQHRALGKRASG